MIRGVSVRYPASYPFVTVMSGLDDVVQVEGASAHAAETKVASRRTPVLRHRLTCVVTLS